MALTEPRRQSADLILTAQETTYASAQEHTIRAFRPTAHTTTTFTDANVTSSATGCFVIPEDGSSQFQPRQIKSVLGTTATVDAPWSTISTASSAIRVWLPADIPVICTTSDASAPNDVIASAHASLTNEPDDYWNTGGWMLIGISGANAGAARLVTDFVSSTGQFVTGFASAVAAGDQFALRKMLRPATDIEASITPKFLERRSIGTGSQGADHPVLITSEGSVKFELEQRPTTAGGSGTVVTAPAEIDDLLRDHFTRRLDTGGTVSAADSTTVTATSSAWSAGGFALLNTGEVTQIFAQASTVLSHSGLTGISTITHASVGVGTVAYASASYVRKATSDNRTRMFDLYRGGKFRQVYGGCMPKLVLTITRDQTVKFGFEYSAAEALEYNIDRPVAVGATYPIQIPDYGVPVDGKGARCLLDGTRVHVTSITIDFGLTPVMRPSISGMNSNDGCIMTLAPVTGKLSVFADQDDIVGFRDLCDRIRRGRPTQFLYQKGTAPGSTFAVGMPAMTFTGGQFGYQEGQGFYDLPFCAMDPELAVAAGSQIYPPATYPGLPSVSIGWI